MRKNWDGCWRLSARVFITLCVAAFAGVAHAQHPGGGDPGETRVTTPAARHADIAVFRAQFLAFDRSYSIAARAEAEMELTRLDCRVAHISQANFDLELAKIAALADNGHTQVLAGPRSRWYNRVGLRLTPFGEDFYVLRTTEANAGLLGARLVAIDRRPIRQVRDVARALQGGTNAWRNRAAPFLLESPDLLAALHMARRADSASYRFQLPDGSLVERRLFGEAPQERAHASSDRWLYPAPVDGEEAPWRAALPVAAAPWSLQEPDVPFRWREDAGLDALVVQFRQTSDAPNFRIADFLSEVGQEIDAKHPRNVVVDMRLNGGGNLQTTREFMQTLPSRVPGRVFVLTSPWTFSAAISSTGYLKQAAPDRVTIVGENVGDRLNFFSEGQLVMLPNSHALILYATERHDYVSGCRPFNDCHPPVVEYPIALPTLAPDIAAPWTIAAYLAGRDPGMEAVAGTLATSR